MKLLLITTTVISALTFGCSTPTSNQTLAETLETGGQLKPEYENVELKKAYLFFNIKPENQFIGLPSFH